MATSLNQTIEILSKEKNIEPQVIIAAIEDAVMSAARKQFKTGEELRARFNDETGEVDLFALMTVVEEVTNPATAVAVSAGCGERPSPGKSKGIPIMSNSRKTPRSASDRW